MRNYTCQTCGEGVLLEPREVEESGAFCLEHLFSEEFPALNELANEASKKEATWPARQDDNQVTQTTTQEGVEDMDQSTELSREDQTNEAVNDLLQAATGLDLYGLQWYLRNSTSLSSEMAWDRLGRGHDWTLNNIIELATLWEVPPSTLATVIHAITEDISAYDLVEEYELDRRPYIISAGGDAL